MDDHKLEGVPYQIRFHLHPEIEAHLDMGGTAVSLALKSGEVWVFRHDGRQEMTLGAFGLSRTQPAEAPIDPSDRSFGPRR